MRALNTSSTVCAMGIARIGNRSGERAGEGAPPLGKGEL
jgi:hypothetical protein